MNKRGDAIGENILMSYRLILVAIIAFVVIGMSTLIYSYDVNVRDVEARILAREVLNCVSEPGFFEKVNLDSEAQYNILDVCKFHGDFSRIFVRLTMYSSSGEERVIQHGDSGSVWVRDIVLASGDEYDEYEPGFYRNTFMSSDGTKIDMEVYVYADV